MIDGPILHNTFDIADTPPREWLVPGIVPAGRFGLVSDSKGGGTGKSRLALQLATALAAGERDWLPGSGVQLDGRPRSVVYANYQNEYAEVVRRLRGIGYDEPDAAFRGRFVAVNKPGVLWDGDKGTASLDHLKSICAGHKADLLVVDPFQRACQWTGRDAAPVKRFFLHLDDWGRDAGTAVMMVMPFEFDAQVYRPRWQMRLRSVEPIPGAAKRTALLVDSIYGIGHDEDDPQWWLTKGSSGARIAVGNKPTAVREVAA